MDNYLDDYILNRSYKILLVAQATNNQDGINMAKLHFYYSAMNAGKSTALRQSNYNYKERGMRTLLFITAIDTRYAPGVIHSRIGLTSEAHVFDKDFDLFEFVKKQNAEILAKDDQRNFNEAQKIAIYRHDKGLCQICLSEGKSEKEARVSWSEYEADHILAHSKGGATDIDNAQVLCRTHNRKKSGK